MLLKPSNHFLMCCASGVKKTNMSRGYSVSVVESIKQADRELLGVRLGLACVYNGIAVAQVAHDLGVTRTTIYYWFCGVRSPHPEIVADVEAYLNSLG